MFLMLSSSLARHGSTNDAVQTAVNTGIRLVPGTTDSLILTPEAAQSEDIHTYEVKVARSHEHLRFDGQLLLDEDKRAPVHSRFAGEVVSVGPLKPGADPVTDPENGRPLRFGDRVEAGQVLAVIWSKDVGEKKSDLVNALSQFALDRAQFDRLKALDPGVVPEKTVREAERQLESDINSVERNERTLRSWRLTDEEIKQVKAEAERIHRRDYTPDEALERTWAEVDVRAPFSGVILEKNITNGDIVDTNDDLFKVADLSRLRVMAHVYEEDLRELQSLAPKDRKWTIHLKAQPNVPGIQGTFDAISNIVDPTEHTAAIMGWLSNADNKLRVGQFVTATVDLPSAPDEVAVPENAVLDEGPGSIVFVASDASAHHVTRRMVAVARRSNDYVYVRTNPDEAERHAGCLPLLPGEFVVITGTVELAAALDSLVPDQQGPSPQDVH